MKVGLGQWAGQWRIKMREVLVVSLRDVVRHPANSMLYEFEDLICDWESADLVSFEHFHGDRSFDLRRRTFQALSAAGVPHRRALNVLRPGGNHPKRKYDLGVVVTSGPYDLFLIDQVQALRTSCESVTVFVAEAWPPSIKGTAIEREPWDLVDTVFVGLRPGAEALSDALPAVNVSFLPLGVDSESFGRMESANRPIDVINPGRKDPTQHASLISAATTAGLWYEFDAVGGASVDDWRAHRQNYGTRLNRSRIVVSNTAKFDYPAIVVGNRPVAPSRVLEAMAAGCRIVGAGLSKSVLSDFGIEPDFVEYLPLNLTVAEASSLLQDESAAPNSGTRRRIAREKLDWAHRWNSMLQQANLAPTPALSDRLDRLQSA